MPRRQRRLTMGARHGQHFLRNRGAIETIISRFDPREDDLVVEIGPGLGALTRPLAERVSRFAAVEIDPALARALAGTLHASLVSLTEHELSASRLTPPLPGPEAGHRLVLQADALDVRYAALAAMLGASPDRRLRVIGNLPYSIATALVRRMLAERHLIEDAMFMVQREVAERILAPPGGKIYGLISVLVSLAASRERVLTLEPGSFVPPPKVRSAVVALRFQRPAPGFAEADARLGALLRAAFSERRKQLASNLAKHYGIPRTVAADHLAACGAGPTVRAETLSPEMFLRLSERLPPPS